MTNAVWGSSDVSIGIQTCSNNIPGTANTVNGNTMAWKPELWLPLESLLTPYGVDYFHWHLETDDSVSALT